MASCEASKFEIAERSRYWSVSLEVVKLFPCFMEQRPVWYAWNFFLNLLTNLDSYHLICMSLFQDKFVGGKK